MKAFEEWLEKYKKQIVTKLYDKQIMKDLDITKRMVGYYQDQNKQFYEKGWKAALEWTLSQQKQSIPKFKSCLSREYIPIHIIKEELNGKD